MQIALIGLIGILLGIAATSFFKWIDRKERFKVMTFEKRLDVHQSAYYWNQRIYQELSSKDASILKKIISDAQQWWNTNCLLLDENSRISMISVFNSTNRYARGIEHPDLATGSERVWDDLDKNHKDIIKGIGVEHLNRIEDERATRSQETDLKSVRRILNKILYIPAPEWVNKYLFRPLFVIGAILFVTIIIYVSYEIPLGSSYTEAVRASFVFNSLAAFIGLMIAYWMAHNRWIALLITVTIELFISGMLFELIALMEKAHKTILA